MKNNKARTQKKNSKKKAQANVRAHLNNMVYTDIAIKIQNGEGKFVEKISNRLTLWHVEYLGDKCRVIYDKERKTIDKLEKMESIAQ